MITLQKNSKLRAMLISLTTKKKADPKAGFPLNNPLNNYRESLTNRRATTPTRFLFALRVTVKV